MKQSEHRLYNCNTWSRNIKKENWRHCGGTGWSQAPATPPCPTSFWLVNHSVSCLSYGLGRRNKEHGEGLLAFHSAAWRTWWTSWIKGIRMLGCWAKSSVPGGNNTTDDSVALTHVTAGHKTLPCTHNGLQTSYEEKNAWRWKSNISSAN